MEEFTYFWNGTFSQWAESFFELDGIEYNCAEQLMMAEKARLFDDEDTLDKIMESDDPKKTEKVSKLLNSVTNDINIDKIITR
jgi:ribA/ribD-fused uncharacterized protein